MDSPRDCHSAHFSADDECLLRERLQLELELAFSTATASELLRDRSTIDDSLSAALHSLRSALHSLTRITHSEDLASDHHHHRPPLKALLLESQLAARLAARAEEKLAECEEAKKELENTVASLEEENRDVGSLLRAAVAEKEAAERRLSSLRGAGGEHRRAAILQIAEKGLQRVGFGFMIGGAAAAGEAQPENQSGSSVSTKSEGSDEGEEEAVSLASTVEKIMKNLRLEIIHLKRSLEESRSDSEHLQRLADEQAQKISECMLYIKSSQERETMLVHNVDELTIEIRDAEEEVVRWREACELEVEAGKTAIQECERKVAMLRHELGRTKAALDASDKKLKLKEELAANAMAAQAAVEATLRLADSRAAEFRERIEELTRQVEEEARRGRKERSGSNRKRVRHICWPWRPLRLTSTSAASRGGSKSRRMLPEMEALLHFNV